MSKYENNQREDVLRDLKEALNDAEDLPREYRAERIMQVFDKHLLLNKIPLQINHYDITAMVSNAKGNMINMPSYVEISKKQVGLHEVRFVAILQSLIGYLNRKDALKRMPEIEFTKRRQK